MLSFRRFLLALSIFLGVLRLCYVEDPGQVAIVKSSIQPVNEPSNTVEQGNVESSNKDDIKPSESSTKSPSSISSSSSISPSLSSSSSSQVPSTVSVLSSSSSSSSVDKLLKDMSSDDGISTSEFEQLVLPTVAPATPQFDIETVTTSLSVEASNTETVPQDKHEKEHEKTPPSLLSNTELKAVIKEDQKQENQQMVEGEKQEESVDKKEKKEEEPVLENIQEIKRDQLVPIVIPQPDDKKERVQEMRVDEIKESKEESKKEKQEDKEEKLEEKKDKIEERQEKKKEENKQDKQEEKKIEDDREKEDKKEVQEKKEPTESPPPAEDKDEDSITEKLKQAEQETKTSSEDMPSFDEFKRQLQQEEEKQKSILNKQKDDPSRLPGKQAKPKPKKIKERKQNNYASVDCGAKILNTNPEATNIFSILQDNRDIYMLNPCSAKIWFIVELCDTAQVRRIDIANFELFSSTPESFRVFVSGRYPTRDWTLLGTFQARDERTLQSFPLEEPIYAKYFKVEMLSHFGKEHYCPISLFRVFGTSMMEELEDHEAGGQDDSDSVDPDDDLIQVLPQDPSVKSKDKTKEPNILATVGDTLMNMVKHAAKKLTGVIKDTNENDTNDKDGITISTVATASSIISSMVFKQQQEQNKPSIVTLIPSEEEDENLQQVKLNKTVNEIVNGTNKTQAKSPDKPDDMPKNENSSFYDKIDPHSNTGSKSTASFTSCKMLVRMLGHSGFGCLMGRVLYAKRGKYHRFTPKEKAPKARQNNNVKTTIIASVDVEKTDTQTDKDKDSKETKEKEGEKKSEKVDEKEKESKRKTPDDEKPLENKQNIGNTSEIIDSNSINKKETIETKSNTPTEVEKAIQVTPSVSSKSIDPTSIIEPSEPQPSKELPLDNKAGATPSLDATSLIKTEPSKENTESTIPKSRSPDSKPTKEQVKKSTDEISTVSNESTSSHIKSIADVQGQSTPREDDAEKSESFKGDVKDSKELSTSSVEGSSLEQKGSCTTIQSGDHSLVQPLKPSKPSECVAPTIMSNLKDVDVLEFKLLDSMGREGTAHPEKPVSQDKPDKPDEPVKPDHSSKEKDHEEEEKDKDDEKKSGKKVSESVSQSDKSSSETSNVDKSSVSTSSLIEPSKAEPNVVVSIPSSGQPEEPPTTPPPVKAALEDSVQPLPPPPVITDSPTEPPSNSEVPLVDEASKPSSSAVNQGLLSSGAQKESIFMRLTNRIKALEQNLTLSTLYMEKLNQKYRKIVEDMQKNFDKKVNLLTNATIKAESVLKSQKEQITQLQAKVNETSKEMKVFTKKLFNLNKDVMERHIIGLFLEVIFIIMLFIVFRRWDRARFRRDLLRDSFKNGTVPTSHTLTAYPEARKTMLLNGQVSTREQLQRSFSTPIVPENIGSANGNVPNRLKEDNCSFLEARKKRSRKRPKSAIIPSSESITSSKSAPELTNQASQSSVVNTTAGLLFSPARGLLNGLSDSLRFSRSNSLDETQIHRAQVSGSSSNNRLHKAKSLDVIQEYTERTAFPSTNKKGRIPTPPPPPPPKYNGMNQKRLPGQLPSNLVNRKGRGTCGNNHFA